MEQGAYKIIPKGLKQQGYNVFTGTKIITTVVKVFQMYFYLLTRRVLKIITIFQG